MMNLAHTIPQSQNFWNESMVYCARDAENGPCRLDKATKRDAWGVRRCCRCGTSWARDFNACLNIDRIAKEHLAGLDRPDYLTVASSAFGG